MRQSVNREFPITIAAIDVGGTKIAGALVTYERAGDPPKVSAEMNVPTNAREGGEQVLESIVGLVDRLASEADVPLDGIGVGAAGVIDPVSGNVRHAGGTMPGWSGQPLRSRLEEAFGIPVATMGDVQAHALGEARWGAARGARSCLCVGVGTGLGGAYVLDGKVLRGHRGAAGHIGHTLHPAADGLTCSCGNRSHVETVTSGTAISAMYQGKAFGDVLDPNLMGDTVAKRANEGEPEAMAVIEAAGRALGEAIGSWCNIFDPELVVLSGTVTQAGPLWHRALDEGFKSQALEPLWETPILYAALGSQAPLVGAAEQALDMLLC